MKTAMEWRTNMSTEQSPKKKTRPPFVPTQQQRDYINEMAGMHMSVTDICKALGISRRTAYKYFRTELENGSARLYATVANRFYAALKRGETWAIQIALRNLQPWRWDRYDKGTTPYVARDGNDIDEIKITFVTPTRKEEPLDLTPAPNPYAGQHPDLSRPAIEKPPPRETTATGAIHEHRPATESAADPHGHLPRWYPPDRVDNTQPPSPDFRPRGKTDWLR
jgi:AcrR family transcriptional regulator